MLLHFNIQDCVGVADNGDGSYRVDLSDGSSRPATEQEISEAQTAYTRAQIPTVTAAQFRLALLDAGLLDAVETFVATAPRDIQLNWEYRLEFERSHPLVAATAYALGKSDTELDQLFMLAATK